MRILEFFHCDLWPQTWPLTDIVIQFSCSFPSDVSFQVSLIIDILGRSYGWKAIISNIYPLTFDLTPWPLTHIMKAICLSFPVHPSYQISLQLHTLFWSFAWKCIFLAKLQWPLTFTFELLPLLIYQYSYLLTFNPSTNLHYNWTFRAKVMYKITCFTVTFSHKGPRNTIWHHNKFWVSMVTRGRAAFLLFTWTQQM